MSAQVGGEAALARSVAGARVRRAREDDLEAVVAAVASLLGELGSTPPPTAQMLAVARSLHGDSTSGVLLVAEAGGGDEAGGGAGPGAGNEHGGGHGHGGGAGRHSGAELVGVLVASFQTAMHVPGRYVLIQDLWVAPAWRSRSVGHELLAALAALADELDLARAEVGLPRDSFANIRATESFYLRNGFAPLGPRMRRVYS